MGASENRYVYVYICIYVCLYICIFIFFFQSHCQHIRSGLSLGHVYLHALNRSRLLTIMPTSKDGAWAWYADGAPVDLFDNVSRNPEKFETRRIESSFVQLDGVGSQQLLRVLGSHNFVLPGQCDLVRRYDNNQRAIATATPQKFNAMTVEDQRVKLGLSQPKERYDPQKLQSRAHSPHAPQNISTGDMLRPNGPSVITGVGGSSLAPLVP